MVVTHKNSVESWYINMGQTNCTYQCSWINRKPCFKNGRSVLTARVAGVGSSRKILSHDSAASVSSACRPLRCWLGWFRNSLSVTAIFTPSYTKALVVNLKEANDLKIRKEVWRWFKILEHCRYIGLRGTPYIKWTEIFLFTTLDIAISVAHIQCNIIIPQIVHG